MYGDCYLWNDNLIFLDCVVFFEVACSLLSACVLIRTERGRFEDVAKSISQLKGVQRTFPVLGRYDTVVDLEASNYKEIGSIVLRMGKISGVVFTESLVEIQR